MVKVIYTTIEGLKVVYIGSHNDVYVVEEVTVVVPCIYLCVCVYVCMCVCACDFEAAKDII